jgi:hypothetical protein
MSTVPASPTMASTKPNEIIVFRKNASPETMELSNHYKAVIKTSELLVNSEYTLYSIRKINTKYGIGYLADLGLNEFFLPSKIGSDCFLNRKTISSWKAKFLFLGQDGASKKINCKIINKM